MIGVSSAKTSGVVDSGWECPALANPTDEFMLLLQLVTR